MNIQSVSKIIPCHTKSTSQTLFRILYSTTSSDEKTSSLQTSNPVFHKLFQELASTKPTIYQIKNQPIPSFLQHHTQTNLPHKLYRRSLKAKSDLLPFSKKPTQTRGEGEELIQREIIQINLSETLDDLQMNCVELVKKTNYKPHPRVLIAIMERFHQLGQFQLSFNLIEQLRRRGPLEEINIATTDVYSTLIRLSWESTHNPELILRLMNRMNDYLIRVRYPVKELLIEICQGIQDKQLQREFRESLKELKAI